MAKKPLKILLLLDIGQTPPANQDFTEILKLEEWKSDAQLVRAMKALGHEVKPFGIYDDIEPLIEELKANRPDLVFNQCEAFNGDRKNEPNIVAMLELFKIPYTGAGPEPLLICKDKGLTKKILSFHRVRVPKFIISKKSRPIKKLTHFSFPAFIKPLDLEASEGIAQASFTENEKDTVERAKYLHEKYGCDVIIEEYIEGREIYVGVIGNERIRTLPPRELLFTEVPDGEPKFATYKAKWDDVYRKKWGIRNGFARSIDAKTERQMNETCRKIYKLFRINGFARIDLRLTDKGDLVFIEANPNPSIAKDEDFALSCDKAGIKYEDMIDQIITLAVN